MEETKKTYETPSMVTYGKIEEVTLGSGIGIFDVLVFGLDGGLIKCNQPWCQTGS